MAELSSFFDANMVDGVPDRQYDATAWANYFSGFIGNGVSNSPANNLQVTAGTGLSVIVDSGIGYINGYYYNNTEPLTININTANATYPRITSIVIELNLNNREITCKTIDGNAQGNPTAPQITQTESTYQLQLATVYIPAGATNIGTITDTRADANVCGWVNILVPPENSINDLAPILNGYFMGNNMALGGGYVKDCNTVYTAGYYTFAEDEGSKNCPPGLQYGVLQVLVGNGGATYSGVGSTTSAWAWQIAYMTKGELWIRQTIGGGEWTSWQELATTNAPTFTCATFEGTTHNNGEVYGGNITEALITNSTIEQPTINGGGMNKVIFEGECKNNGTIEGGTYIAPNISGGNITALLTNLNTISGGNYDNPTLSGAINNAGTINGGTISNVTINNTNFEGTINNFTTIQGGTYNESKIKESVISASTMEGGIYNDGTLHNCSTTGSFNIGGNMQAMGENVVQYQNIPFSVLISTGVTLSGTCEFWLLNGPNLTGESINGAIGVMTVTGSVNSTYTWETDNHFPVDLSQIPNMTAITQTPFAPFQIGAGTGTMYLKGNNRTLNAGTTYTVQALAFQ